MRRWRRWIDPPVEDATSMAAATDGPPLLDHPFEGYQLGQQVICIHLDGIRPCGRPEHEHAPASDDHGGVAEAGS